MRFTDKVMPLEPRQVQGQCSNARHGAERFRCSNQVPPVTAPVTKKPIISDILNSSILLPSSAITTESVVMTAVITSPMARFLRTSDFRISPRFSMSVPRYRP